MNMAPAFVRRNDESLMIAFQMKGCALEVRVALSAENTAKVAVLMIASRGMLLPDDKITVGWVAP